ncbi:hypothetical protein PG911_12990 [Tenacibaculum ovolyticum]|uniref:hypothetical protein n=1 Tax=Tenacibaculum ovolyticum TaxID=104270 RepID=UPI000AAC14EF|nr:hypothetical protein [Tenacibaculum ovolyticum]WBX75565.1 hypothetical protein PG911_12990 [Tenacibaculum ovolyticum]
MKKKLLLLIVILSCGISNAQLEMRLNPYIKGKIILKNDSIRSGYIRLASSAFRVQFKENAKQKGREKIDYKKIKKILLYTGTPNEREFYYKKTDAYKFLKFVELLYRSKYDVYVNSSNDLSLFYKDVDRSNVSDFLSSGSDFINQPYRSVSKIKEDLMQVENPKYLLKNKDTDELQFIYSNRKLRKKAKNIFKGCPKLIKKIENKELKTDNIIEIIDFYNSCSKTEIERE